MNSNECKKSKKELAQEENEEADLESKHIDKKDVIKPFIHVEL